MEENKFIVDLTGIKLSAQQKERISKSIQTAAMRELAGIDTKGDQYGFLKGKLGVLDKRFPRIEWYGIIIRSLENRNFEVKNIFQP
jgi:hypothetical protein